MNSIRKNLPSRNTSIFLGTIATLVGLKQYDKYECKKHFNDLKLRVSDLAERPLEATQMPDKYVIFLHSPENTNEALYKSKEYFSSYIKPVWDAAAIDYEIILEKEGGEIQSYVYNELVKLRGDKQDKSKDINLAPSLTSPILGWIALGKEAYGKMLLGIHEGSSIKDINHTLNSIKEEDKKVIDNNISNSNIEVEEKTELSKIEEKKVVTLNCELKPLLGEDILKLENLEVPANIPGLGYIRLHHYVGFMTLPLRIYQWFTDRKFVSQIGEDSIKPLLEKPKVLNLPDDYFRFKSLDNRSRKINETSSESLAFIKDLENRLRGYDLEN